MKCPRCKCDVEQLFQMAAGHFCRQCKLEITDTVHVTAAQMDLIPQETLRETLTRLNSGRDVGEVDEKFLVRPKAAPGRSAWIHALEARLGEPGWVAPVLCVRIVSANGQQVLPQHFFYLQ